MKISTDLIRKLKDETGAPIMRVKKVLEEVKGDEKKAAAILKEEGFAKAAKKAERTTAEGRIFAYTHHTGKVASVVEILCETDFVARNALFDELGKSLALQVAFSNPKDAKDLEGQEFIKDPTQKVSDLVKSVIAKTGENIRVGRVFRVELGK